MDPERVAVTTDEGGEVGGPGVVEPATLTS
jgi:hypothetical protein